MNDSIEKEPALFNHIKFSETEEHLYHLAQEYPALQHAYGDANNVPGSFKDVIWHVVYLRSSYSLNFNKGSSIFFSLFLAVSDEDVSPFYHQLHQEIQLKKAVLIKADTASASISFAVVAEVLHAESDIVSVGSIDGYVENKHFLKNDKSFYYSSLAAASDVGARGALPKRVWSFLINSTDVNNETMREVKKVLRYETHVVRNHRMGECKEEIHIHVVEGEQYKKDKVIPKEGMKVYLVGYLGDAARRNYSVSKEYLAQNAGTVFRKSVFDSLGSGVWCATDVSDGLSISAKNLCRQNVNLEVQFYEQELMRHCRKLSSDITKEQVFSGGDDYALLIATNTELKHEHCSLVGEITACAVE